MWKRSEPPAPLIDPARLQFGIQNHLNVLLQGRHGVGKTALVKQAFEKAGLRLLVFSGSTMDPWVDFVGVPRIVSRPDGKSVLELVRRPELEDDEIDAIFIDEFNRAPAKARNAAMELLQLKSVNGQPFQRLKMVWAAINPADEDYDTERLDPAQRDRFHMFIEVPPRPCPCYFTEKFGSLGAAALEWWDLQSEEAKALVTPRRLDFALGIALGDGPVRDVLPAQANIKAFLKLLQEGPVFESMKDLMARGDKKAARALITDPMTGGQALAHVVNSRAARLFFLPLLDAEALMSLLSNASVLDTVVRYADHVPQFENALVALMGTDQEGPLRKQARALAKIYGVRVRLDAQGALLSVKGEPDANAIKEVDPYGRFAS